MHSKHIPLLHNMYCGNMHYGNILAHNKGGELKP